MDFRKTIWVVGLILFLMPPAYSDSIQFNLGAIPSSCSQKPISRSQSSMIQLMDKLNVCNTFTDSTATVTIDQKMCTRLNECSDSVFKSTGSKSDINIENDSQLKQVLADMTLLDFHTKQYLIQEELEKEFKKIQSPQAKNAILMKLEMDTLPPEFKSKLKSCSNNGGIRTEKTCLEDPAFNLIVMNELQNKIGKIVEDNLKTCSKNQSQINSTQQQVNIFSKIHDKNEKVADSSFAKLTNYDSIIETTCGEQNESNPEQSSKQKMSLTLKMVNSLPNGNQLVAAELEKLKITPNEYKNYLAGKGTLPENKINQVKVDLYNNYISNNCNKVTTSFDQVCKNIQSKYEKGDSLSILKNGTDSDRKKLINDIIEKIRTQPANKVKDTDIANLTRIAGAQTSVYRNYMPYVYYQSLCSKKSFTSNKSRTQKMYDEKYAEVAKDHQTSSTEVAEKTQVETMNNIQTIVQSDPYLKNVITLPSYESKDIKTTSSQEIVSVNNQVVNNSQIASDNFQSSLSNTKDQNSNLAGINNFNNSNKTLDSSLVDAFNKSVSQNNEVKQSPIPPSQLPNSDDAESKLKARIAELEQKEKALATKTADSPISTDATNQMEDLRKQIDELKAAQEKAAIENKAKVAGNPTTESIKSASRFADAPNGRGSSIFGNKQSEANNLNDYQNNPNRSGSNFNSNSSQDVNNSSTSNLNGSRGIATNGTNGAIKNNTVNSGIVLTKSGEVLIDPTKILDNPQEGDIVNIIEQTKGQPFLIRENGVLMSVAVILDSTGNPQMANGKPVYKKIRLSKDQEKSVTKEVNLQKSLKEVGPDHVRLFNLKNLIDQSVQRN